MDLKLFERHHQSLSLTNPAKIYLREVENALKNIERASAKIINSKKEKEILNINVLPSMSSRFLIPLLHDFREKFPNYDVIVKTGDGDVNFKKLGCDLAIRAFSQKSKLDLKNIVAEKIMGEKLLCICSSDFKKKNKIGTAKDLLLLNLLNHTYRPKMWQEYFAHFGLKKIKLNHSNGFEHFFMLIEAAKNGLGLGLVPEFLIKKELEEKTLVIAIKDDFISAYSYFLLQQKQKNVPKKISDFNNWLTSYCKK